MELIIDNPIRLNSNENLLGPSPIALAAMQSAMLETHLYPDDHATILTNKLVAMLGHGIDAEQLVLGNGSGDVLRAAIQTYVLPDDEVIVPHPTFIAYKRLTSVHRGKLVTVPLVDYQVDLAGLLAAITPKTKLIFLCNPNNPTGQIVTHAALEAFLQQLPQQVTLVLDEAYVDFVDEPTFPRAAELVQAGHNLIVARTFSKVYGLASLRVGYGFGRNDLITPIRSSRHQGDTGRIAYLGAAAALNDEAHIVSTIEMVQAGREYLYAELEKLGLRYLPSQAFYVLLTNVPLKAQLLVDEVAKHGVLIRHTNVFEMPGYVRISVGRPEDNQQAIAALRKVLTAHNLLPI